MTSTETDAQIRPLIQQSGWFDDCAISAVGGTGNNRVYRLESDGKTYLLKRYFKHPDDPRDRFATERAFYTFLWNAGVRRTPEPLEWHEELRIALFEFVNGKRPEQATRELILQALSFFNETNARRFSPEATSLPNASEACFSIREHLDRIDQRVRRLQNIEPATGIHERAKSFVQDNLTPAWHTVRDTIVQKSSPEFLNQTLEGEGRCLSPSDFGFHNAICASEGTLRFFDFEYAGWDDPAKMVCDFFCQPAVPLPLSLQDEFIAEIAAGFDPGLSERVSLLFPVYRIKWCCIMLNDFLATENSRRAFSNPSHDEFDRKQKQLEKAVQFFRQVNP